MNKKFLRVCAFALLTCIGTINCGTSMRGKSRKGGGGRKTASRKDSRRCYQALAHGQGRPSKGCQNPRGYTEVAAILKAQPYRAVWDRHHTRKANKKDSR